MQSVWLCGCLSREREEAVTQINNFTENFSQICAQHERTLENITLNSTRLSSLPPELFYCHGLRVLSVSGNNLENIPNAIGSLRQLQILNVNRNFISSVPDNLKNCKNLTHLDLSCNSLQRLPDAITCLVSLQELLLNEMYLEFLPANFGRLVNLRILELRLNSLVSLPKSMARLTNLERIDIGGNEFNELPEVIGELYKLRELWIDLNQIRRIPPNIGKLQNLQHLEANGNLLESLPDEICSWNKVEVLSICTNYLKSLPMNFGCFLGKTLVTFKCEYCKLEELPESISSLHNLEEIVVSHNQLRRLPTTIGMLRKLRFIFADDNCLQALPDEICSCCSLTVLSLSRNKLSDIPQNIGHLSKLKVLNLVGNNISTLPVSLLSIVNLLSLWLSENQTQPLVHLQYTDSGVKTRRLTCFMLPQNSAIGSAYLENDVGITETKATNNIPTTTHASSSLRRICFAKDDDDDDEEEEENCNGTKAKPKNVFCSEEEQQLEPVRLMRSPTPYPKELRLMSKYVRSTQKYPSSQTPSPPPPPASSNAKEAQVQRLIDNSSYIKNKLENNSIINDDDNNHNNTNSSDAEGDQYKSIYYSMGPSNIHKSNHIPSNMTTNFYDQRGYMHSHQLIPPTNYNANSHIHPNDHHNEFLINTQHHNDVYSDFNETPLGNQEEVLKCYLTTPPAKQQQTQQFITPPPYYIARNYTKKTVEDLSNYDSMRRLQYLRGGGGENQRRRPPTSVSDKISISENDIAFEESFPSATPQDDNKDEQNNILYERRYQQNGIELSERISSQAAAEQLQQKDDVCTNDKNNFNSMETILNDASENPPPPMNTLKKKAWLFGVHKNPTVKQINLKEKSVYPIFHIERMPNEEGIFISWIAPDTNASRFLCINDKILEVNGYDFTNISLQEANKLLLDNAGAEINIMVSRK